MEIEERDLSFSLVYAISFVSPKKLTKQRRTTFRAIRSGCLAATQATVSEVKRRLSTRAGVPRSSHIARCAMRVRRRTTVRFDGYTFHQLSGDPTKPEEGGSGGEGGGWQEVKPRDAGRRIRKTTDYQRRGCIVCICAISCRRTRTTDPPRICRDGETFFSKSASDPLGNEMGKCSDICSPPRPHVGEIIVI